MAASADWYILINVVTGSVERVAEKLKALRFDNVRMTNGLNSPIDIIIFFNSSNMHLSALSSQIHAIIGVTNVVILPAFPV